MLVARELTKEFQSGSHQLTVLRDVSFAVPQGAFVAIVGPSGSGKTTLLGLLAGLDTPSRGTVILDGVDLGSLTEDQRAKLRGEKVGFIFQSFQLIPTLTALENVQVPLELRGDSGGQRKLVANVWVGDTNTTFHIRAPFPVKQVLLDPDYQVLRWTPELRSNAVARAPLTRADFERRYGNSKRALELFRLALDSLPRQLDTTSLRFSVEYGFALASLATRDTAQALDALKRAVAAPIRDPLTLPRAYLSLSRIAFARGDSQLALRAALDAVTADRVVGNQVGAAETVKSFSWVSNGPPLH